MKQGYVKLYRTILDSCVFDNPKLLKVWIWCLCKASYKEHDQVVGRQVQHLRSGQFIYGRKKAAMELNIPESTLNDYMQLLKKMKKINIKSNNKYSVVTIENWATYQIDGYSSDTKSDNKSATNKQQMDTNKNDKNEKNDNRKGMKRNEATGNITGAQSRASKASDGFNGYEEWIR